MILQKFASQQDTLQGPQKIWKVLMRYEITSICRQKYFQNLSFVVFYGQQ